MTVEELQVLITANTDSLRKEINNTQNTISGLSSKISKSGSSIMSGVIKGNIVTKILGKTISMLTANLDGAIQRMDTLNNYPRVMSNLGISAEDADASMKRLSDALVGLPTTLNDAVSSVQRFTSANGNVKASTEMFLALNNAILAGGAEMQTQKTALEQLSQAYTKGKPDMMEWRSAMTAMPAQLKQVAMAMGYVSADQLGEALRSGSVSMNDFMKKLIELNKTGANGFQSFEEQARNSTGGVATSIANVKTAFTRGMADIMNAIGQANIAGFFQGIARAISTVTSYVVAFIKVISTAVSYVARLFGGGVGKSANNTAKSVSNVSDSLSSLGSSAGGSAGGMDKATGSAKKLKKELQGLASFDDMNVLKENDTDSGGSGGGSGGGAGGADLSGLDLGDFNWDLDESISKADLLAEKMTNVAQKIFKVFGEGFSLSFGDTNFDGIIKHAQNVKNSLISIFSDPAIGNAFQTTVNTMVFTLGEVVGGIARIATNIAEGLIGGIDNYLSQNSGRIKSFIVEMFNISTQDMKLTGALWKALGEISDVFKGSEAKQIGANIIAMFANPFMSVITTLSQFVVDFRAVLVQPIIDNSEKIKTALENAFKVWEKYSGTLATAFTYIGDKFKEVYDKGVKPVLDSLKNGLSNTFGKLLDVYNQYVAPAMDRMQEKFSELWENNLKPLVDKVSEFFITVGGYLQAFWENILQPVINWIVENVVPLIVPVIETIWNIVCNAVATISDVIGGVIEVLTGVYEFITGVFSGNWQKAWDGIKKIFQGVWDTIKGIVTGVVNHIKTIFEPVVNWFNEHIIEPLRQMFEPVANWFNEHVVEPIKNFFSPLFNWFKQLFTNIWNFIKSVFQVIGDLARGCVETVKAVWGVVSGWFNEHIINPVKNAFTGFWNTLKTGASNAWSGIKSVFSSVASWFKSIFTTAWTNVKNVFSTGGKIFDGIKEGIVNAFKNIVNAIIRGINKVVATPFNAINNVLSTLHNVEIAGYKPFGFVHTFSVPQIPQLARGGIVDKPTYAMIGEAGKEVVMPLERNTGWIDQLADKLNDRSEGQPIQLIVNVGEETLLDRLIDRIEQKNFETNGEAFSL